MALNLLQKKPDAIGVEIGTSAIKVVVLKAGSPPSLLHAVMVPTPTGAVRDGMVIEPQLVANELKALLAAHKISNKQVVVPVPNQSAISRNIMVPRMPYKELKEAIRYQAEQYIPYPIDEVQLDFAMLEDPDVEGEGDQMEVLIAAASSESVARVLEVMTLAGLEPVVVELKSFAALRALKGELQGVHHNPVTMTGDNYTEEGEVALVLEIGASQSVINLVRGTRILMNRNVQICADDFTTALQKVFDVPFNTAEQLKIQYVHASVADTQDEEALLSIDPATTSVSVSNERIHETLQPIVLALVTEIRRSLEFYRTQSGDIAIDRTYLTGGGAKLSGLPEAISESLGFDVTLASPWLSVSTDRANTNPGTLHELGPEFTVPLGMALRGVSVPAAQPKAARKARGTS